MGPDHRYVPRGATEGWEGAKVYVATHGHYLHAVHVNGSAAWKFDLEGKSESSPALSASGWTVYVGSDADKLYAVDAYDGSERWTVSTDNDVRSMPAVGVSGAIAALGNMVGDKSRAQGASWIMVAIIVWFYVFHDASLLGFGSKDEETADDPSSPDSLGWKIDFLLEKLPDWMRPRTERKYSTHTWKNLDNGSYIKAYAATKGIARGGRYLLFFLDESAAFLIS